MVGRRLGRTVWVAYLTTGAALAIFRVSLLAWMYYRWGEGKMTQTWHNLFWFFGPEMGSNVLLVWGDTYQSVRSIFLFWASVLTVGSFIMATPVPLVVWLRQRRR